MLLVIDNYDSFTYNVVQYFRELGAKVLIKRNDAITLDAIEALNPQGIVISPGPCTPTEAGISLALIKKFATLIPILGVCLGHQSLAQAFGGRIIHAHTIMHGKTSEITHDGTGIFRGLYQPLRVTRYHSLVVDKQTLPSTFIANAWANDGEDVQEIMGIQHTQLPLYGVQFHPESILSQQGHRLFYNFLQVLQNTHTTGNHWFPEKALSYFSLSDNTRAWLSYPGSLTGAQRATAHQYKLTLARQNWETAYGDEQQLLSITSQEKTFIRHVDQWCDNKLTVVGRTVFPASTFNEGGKILEQLGEEPLGDIIFKEATLIRSPFQYAQLRSHDPLYKAYIAPHLATGEDVWARRSIFTFLHKPLLVTEIFIPPLPRFPQEFKQ